MGLKKDPSHNYYYRVTAAYVELHINPFTKLHRCNLLIIAEPITFEKMATNSYCLFSSARKIELLKVTKQYSVQVGENNP